MVDRIHWSVHMQVSTTRFGTVEIDDDRVINFATGLLGFGQYTRYALLQPNTDAAFYWLQCVEAPDLAFVVTDPTLFVTGYEVPVRKEQMEALGLASLEDAQVLVIVNRYGQSLTGNLQGPIVVNTQTRQGEQIVLSDQRWTTRYKLMEVPEEAQAASA